MVKFLFQLFLRGDMAHCHISTISPIYSMCTWIYTNKPAGECSCNLIFEKIKLLMTNPPRLTNYTVVYNVLRFPSHVDYTNKQKTHTVYNKSTPNSNPFPDLPLSYCNECLQLSLLPFSLCFLFCHIFPCHFVVVH